MSRYRHRPATKRGWLPSTCCLLAATLLALVLASSPARALQDTTRPTAPASAATGELTTDADAAAVSHDNFFFREIFADEIVAKKWLRWVGPACVTAYLLLFLWSKYIFVQTPSINAIRAHRIVLKALRDDDVGSVRKMVDKLIAESERLVPDDVAWQSRLVWSFTGNSRYLTALKVLHEANGLVFAHMRHAAPLARSRALTVLAQLQELPGSPDKLRKDIQQKLKDGSNGEDIAPLIQEAEGYIYAVQDSNSVLRDDARNKGYWLFATALITVAGLAVVWPLSSILLFAGAIGGLLARLRKAVSQATDTFDYAASWGVLFLTPLVGAITGWFGVTLFSLFAYFNSIGLYADGSAAGTGLVNLENPNGFTFIVAFVFGWSATLFDAFAQRLEKDLEQTNRQRQRTQQRDQAALENPGET